MPRVKIDYIVSFSNEDSENPASNLLSWDVSKKKWLCNKGEATCSVVLQLKNAVQINSIQIGAYHSALVEVLVGLSEKPNDPFEVLVPSSVFLSPSESRRGEGVERVRSFTTEQLSAARDRRWDRVRLVCSQPYNKHCKYGLSFVHIHSPEPPAGTSSPPPAVASAVPPRLAPVGLPSDSASDDEEFRPGELFAKHVQDTGKNTDAQIRQATSQALKNISDAATKLTKTPISKTNSQQKSPSEDHYTDRQRDSLMYTDDDEEPNAKIDRIIDRHNDEKAKARDVEEKKTPKHDQRKDGTREKRDDSKQRQTDSSHSKKKEDRNKTPQSNKKDTPSSSRSRESSRDMSSSSQKEKKDSRKRTHSEDKAAQKSLKPGPVSSTPHTLLSGVVFVLSGYENPRRAALRDQALAMGARYLRDWGPEATHLICAFPNTPKLRAVRASPNGAAAVVATGEWLEQCCARRRRLPWQWFATEPGRRLPPGDAGDDADDAGLAQGDPQSDEGNTDDEIERVLRQEKKPRTRSPPKRDKEAKRSLSPQISANVSSASDVVFVRDERIQGNVTVQDSDDDAVDTDEDIRDETPCKIDDSKTLPDFFDGYTFSVDDSVAEVTDKDLVIRYIKAYGGLVVDASQPAGGGGADYAVSGRAGAAWLWRCHARRALCPPGAAGYGL